VVPLAVTDPTRRALMQRLMQNGPDTATRLAADLPLTRQAVVKHLQALVDAGLATPKRDGREVRYRVIGSELAATARRLDAIGAEWDRRLAAIKEIAEGL